MIPSTEHADAIRNAVREFAASEISLAADIDRATPREPVRGHRCASQVDIPADAEPASVVRDPGVWLPAEPGSFQKAVAMGPPGRPINVILNWTEALPK